MYCASSIGTYRLRANARCIQRSWPSLEPPVPNGVTFVEILRFKPQEFQHGQPTAEKKRAAERCFENTCRGEAEIGGRRAGGRIHICRALAVTSLTTRPREDGACSRRSDCWKPFARLCSCQSLQKTKSPLLSVATATLAWSEAIFYPPDIAIAFV